MAPIVVLHVDDDADVLDRAATFLEAESNQLRLRTATSGEKALRTLRAYDIDCVVSEYEIPDTTGLDLLEAVRKRRAELPFILFTDAGSEAVASRAISAGVTDYVRKRGSSEGYAEVANRIEKAVRAYRDDVALRESEERYRTIVEESPDASYITRDGRFTFVNERACELTGYGADELRGMDVRSLLHRDDCDRLQSFAANREDDDLDGTTYEARFQTKDGETRYGEFSVRRTTSDGRPATIGSIRDMTDWKRTGNRLHALIEHSYDLIALVDNSGVFRYHSPSIERFGYDPDEIVGDSSFEYIHPEDRSRTIEAFHQVVNDPDGYRTVTYRFRCADGSWRYLETTGENRLDDPAVEGLVLNSRDVTDQKNGERTLEALHDTTRELMAAETTTAVSRIAVRAARDVLDLPLTGIWWYDDSAFRLVARTEEHHTTYEDDETMSDRSAATDALETGETVVRRRGTDDDGSEAFVPLENRGVMAFGGERLDDFDVYYAQLLASNTAAALDRAAREDERKSSQRELKRQNERLEEFASVVSHDLRNPLNVAQGYLDMYGATGEAAHLSRVERAHDRMADIIEDVLALARQGQMVSETKPVSGKIVTTNAWATVETGSATLDASWDATIDADESRLQQLLENLFRNAVDHGQPDVTVRVGELDAGGGSGVRADDTSVGFFVEDDGPGIGQSIRETVFDSGYSTSEGGTGLGLTIVRQIADAHGWAVSLGESEYGGARFEFTGVELADE